MRRQSDSGRQKSLKADLCATLQFQFDATDALVAADDDGESHSGSLHAISPRSTGLERSADDEDARQPPSVAKSGAAVDHKEHTLEPGAKVGAEPEAEPKQSMKVEPEHEAELEHRTSSDCASASGAAGRLVTESVPGTLAGRSGRVVRSLKQSSTSLCRARRYELEQVLLVVARMHTQIWLLGLTQDEPG